MLFTCTMTLLTSHAEYVIISAVSIGQARICDRFKEGCMTFEAPGHDRSAEIYRPIAIGGTVDPAAHIRPIGNGKLKELIFFVPVKRGLTFTSGAADEVEAFRDRNGVGRRSEHTR